MNIQVPKPTVNIEDIRRKYHSAVKAEKRGKALHKRGGGTGGPILGGPGSGGMFAGKGDSDAGGGRWDDTTMNLVGFPHVSDRNSFGSAS